MISLEKKFLFVHIPKTGGNSIQTLLRKYSEDEVVSSDEHQDGHERFEVSSKYGTRKHSTLAEYKARMDPAVFASLYKFAVIRNPWDMMISWYFSPHRKVDTWDRDGFLSLVKQVPALRYYTTDYSMLTKVLRKLGVAVNYGGKALDADIDFLIRFEHMQDDFQQVCERLDIPFEPMPHRNRSERKHYSDYYDEELRRVVERKFWKEIEYGKYRFEE